MPIDLSTEWQTGWLHRDPTDPVLVIVFKNLKTGKRMFTYAPKHEDKEFFMNVFEELEEYEKTKKDKKCVCSKE